MIDSAGLGMKMLCCVFWRDKIFSSKCILGHFFDKAKLSFPLRFLITVPK